MNIAEPFILSVLLLSGAMAALAQPPAPAGAATPVEDSAQAAPEAAAGTDAVQSSDAAATADPVPATADPVPATNPVAGNAPGERIDRVSAGGATFGVRVLPITGGPAKGAIVLVPGDGRFPGTSRGIAVLQTGMPPFGWSTWTPEIESPPRTHAQALDPVAAEPGAAPPEPAPPAETPPLEALRAQELQEWATRGQQRLATVVAAAAAEGQVVVVAEGVGAALATGLAATLPNGIHAFALLDPVELPGLAANWPRGIATPVLEVLDPALGTGQAAERRARANASGLHYYRQIVVPLGEGTAPGVETPLVRRLRGWLRSLEQPDAH